MISRSSPTNYISNTSGDIVYATMYIALLHIYYIQLLQHYNIVIP